MGDEYQSDTQTQESTLVCTACGMTQDRWGEFGADGYNYGGDLFCCRGCAEQTGCTC